MFRKILIASRGAVALRIARTCERLGVATVSVHTDRDRTASHTSSCDETVAIGEASQRDPYSDAQAVVAAAVQSGADAIHPGSGPLARSPEFARLALEAGLQPIGCPAEVLERFSNVPAARELAAFAGVRALPHARLERGPVRAALEVARELGYPLRVRATVDDAITEWAEDESELAAAIGRCRDRASAAHDDPDLYLELPIQSPRMLAVLLMSDARGDCIALGELERCVERTTGRVLLEELPAPALVGLPRGALKRRILWDSASRIAKEGKVVGPAIAEFVLDEAARLHFTRFLPALPIEHGLFEMCSGVDVVEAQLRIAAGERMPIALRRAQPSGHAIQARICPEPPASGLGSERIAITHLRWPSLAPRALRIESDLVVDEQPSTDLDPLLARVLAYGQTRHQALLTLDRVLAEARIDPFPTNIARLRAILGDESFRSGQYDESFVDRLNSEQVDPVA